MYVVQATLRSLAKHFKKLGGIRGLYLTSPDHFYVQCYARMRVIAEAAEPNGKEVLGDPLETTFRQPQ